MTDGPAALSPCASLARGNDRERFLAAMFAPPDRREAVFALIAFNCELAKTAAVVSEPLLGQIRLQWWRDALAEAAAGRPRRHEVVEPLATALAAGALPVTLLEALVDARERDLDDAPPADTAALVAYARSTGGTFAEVWLQLVWPHGSDPGEGAFAAARAAGTAYALAGLLRSTLPLARQGRVMLPADRLGEDGTTALRDLKPSPAIAAAAAAVADAAMAELALAAKGREAVPAAARSALLSAHLARHHIRRMRRAPAGPLDPRVATRLPLAPLWLLLAYTSGRI